MKNVLLQNNFPTIPPDPLGTEWIFAITTVPLILYAVLVSFETYSFVWLSRVVFSNRYASNAYRNRSLTGDPSQVIFLFISLTGLANLAYFAEEVFSLNFYGYRGTLLWLLNLGFFILALAARFIVNRITASITGSKDLFNEYAFNIVQFYKFITLPLIIINFCIPYFDLLPDRLLIFVILFFFVLMFIIRMIRLWFIFIRKGVSLFYYILYLCALEFMPILVLAKYLSGTV